MQSTPHAHLRLCLAERLLEAITQQAHTLHLCLQLPHAVVLHAPPLQCRVIGPSRGGRCGCGRRPRHAEREGGLAMRTLEASSAFSSSLQAQAAAGLQRPAQMYKKKD